MKKLIFALFIGLLFASCKQSQFVQQPQPQKEKEAVVFKQNDAYFSRISKEDAKLVFENMAVFNSQSIIIDTVLGSPVVSTETNEVQFNYDNHKVIRVVDKMTPGRLDSIFSSDHLGIKVARYRFSLVDETFKYIFMRQPDGSLKLMGNAKLYLGEDFYQTRAGTTATGCILMYYPVINRKEDIDEQKAEGVNSSPVIVEEWIFLSSNHRALTGSVFYCQNFLFF